MLKILGVGSLCRAPSPVCGFGIRVVLASFHWRGSLPTLQHLLKPAVSLVPAASFRFLSAFLLTRSGPDAERLFRSCIAFRTSQSSMSRSTSMFSAPWYSG